MHWTVYITAIFTVCPKIFAKKAIIKRKSIYVCYLYLLGLSADFRSQFSNQT